MSQFDGLLDIKTGKKLPPQPAKTKTVSKPIAAPPPMPTYKETDRQRTMTPVKELAKSKHTDYVQTSIYIKKETQTKVKRALLIDERNRDFSELVEELISDWAGKNDTR